MQTKWVYSRAGTPIVADFAGTRGLGTPVVIDESTDTPYYLKAGVVTAFAGGGGGGTAWGSITGTLSDQTDLQAALDTKANLAGGNTFVSNQAINAASALTNSGLFFRDDTGLNQGAIFWDRSPDQVKLRRYNAAGTAAEGELSLAATLCYYNSVQIITMSDVFASGTAGIVPASGGGTTTFLRADGTWAAPVGFTNWTTIYDSTISSSIAGIDLDVTAYNEVIVQLHAVTAVAPSFRGVVVSVDGGSTFYAGSTDYFQMDDAGTTATTFIPLSTSTTSSAARSIAGQISLLRESNIPKPIQNYSRAGLTRYLQSSISLAPITHIRICSLSAANTYSNLTAGTVIVKGR